MKHKNAYEVKRLSEIVEAGLRTVKQHQCKCGAQCLRGDDDDRISMTAICDIEPIDHYTETIAILDGLGTYDICPAKGKTAQGGAFILWHRDRWHYLNPVRKYPVLIEHQCRKAA